MTRWTHFVQSVLHHISYCILFLGQKYTSSLSFYLHCIVSAFYYNKQKYQMFTNELEKTDYTSHQFFYYRFPARRLLSACGSKRTTSNVFNVSSVTGVTHQDDGKYMKQVTVISAINRFWDNTQEAQLFSHTETTRYQPWSQGVWVTRAPLGSPARGPTMTTMARPGREDYLHNFHQLCSKVLTLAEKERLGELLQQYQHDGDVSAFVRRTTFLWSSPTTLHLLPVIRKLVAARDRPQFDLLLDIHHGLVVDKVRTHPVEKSVSMSSSRSGEHQRFGIREPQ